MVEDLSLPRLFDHPGRIAETGIPGVQRSEECDGLAGPRVQDPVHNRLARTRACQYEILRIMLPRCWPRGIHLQEQILVRREHLETRDRTARYPAHPLARAERDRRDSRSSNIALESPAQAVAIRAS